MVQRKSLTIGMGESFHLPRDVWSAIQEQQKETHPDISLDEYKFEVIVGSQKHEIERDDPKCPSGKRKVEVTIEFYVTFILTGKLTKNPEKECSYTLLGALEMSQTRARFKSHKDGDCVPKK